MFGLESVRHILASSRNVVIVLSICFVTLSAYFTITHLRSGSKPSAAGAGVGVVVVSAGRQDKTVNQSQGSSIVQNPESSTAMSAPESAAVRSAISSLLPSLQNVQVDCTASACRVTANPQPANGAVTQQALEQLVTTDIPNALARSGYALTEPLQIEEIGADQYGLIFRLSNNR